MEVSSQVKPNLYRYEPIYNESSLMRISGLLNYSDVFFPVLKPIYNEYGQHRPDIPDPCDLLYRQV